MYGFGSQLPRVALVVAGLLIVPSAAAQDVVPARRVGMSGERLERLTTEARRQVKKGNHAGLVSLVARRGEIVYLKAVGKQDRERNVKMRTDTIFRAASFTKSITSLAVLMLYEEGRIQLTDPVSDRIPEFKHMKVIKADGTLEDARREITVYDLLTHNSGIAYHDHAVVGWRYHRADITSGLEADKDPIGEDIRKLGRIPLAQQPGTGFLYGLNADVLGYLIERVTDKTLAEFFEQRFFVPLGMKDTAFFLDGKDAHRLAQLYVLGEQDTLVPENSQERIIEGYPVGGRKPIDGPKVSFSGGGGLCTTCEDYFRFCQMVLQKGEYRGKRFLSRKTIEQATKRHLPLPEGFFCADSSDFGLGFAVQRDTGSTARRGFRRRANTGRTTVFLPPETGATRDLTRERSRLPPVSATGAPRGWGRPRPPSEIAHRVLCTAIDQ